MVEIQKRYDTPEVAPLKPLELSELKKINEALDLQIQNEPKNHQKAINKIERKLDKNKNRKEQKLINKSREGLSSLQNGLEKNLDKTQFVKNKFIRLDSVFEKNSKKVYTKKEDLGNPTAGVWLDLQRENVKYKIEAGVGIGHNYHLYVTDGQAKYEIMLNHWEEAETHYDMSVKLNGKTVVGQQAKDIATKYVGLL